jgi:hypothetical protein
MHLDRALSLQKLNHLKPDGGRRIAEAEEAYRFVGVENNKVLLTSRDHSTLKALMPCLCMISSAYRSVSLV